MSFGARHLKLRLTASSLDFWVDVRLRQLNGRWLAVAEIAGDPEIGYGATRRDAIAMALAPLGPAADLLLAAGVDAPTSG